MKDENAEPVRPKGRKRRVYSREFKLQALEQVADGSSVAEVARQLGIHPSTLRRWRAQRANETETPSARPPDRPDTETEILRLGRELERVTRERDAALQALASAGVLRGEGGSPRTDEADRGETDARAPATEAASSPASGEPGPAAAAADAPKEIPEDRRYYTVEELLGDDGSGDDEPESDPGPLGPSDAVPDREAVTQRSIECGAPDVGAIHVVEPLVGTVPAAAAPSESTRLRPSAGAGAASNAHDPQDLRLGRTDVDIEPGTRWTRVAATAGGAALLLALVIVIFQLGEPSARDRPVRAVALEPPKVEPPPARVTATAEAMPSRSARREAPPAKPSDAARLTTRLTDERYEPEAPAERAVSPRQAVPSGIPSSELAEEVESILALLLEDDDPDARGEGVDRLSELEPREVGPELVRQLNARRMGTRRDPRLRDAWQRAREVLCEGAARDPEAGPPPIVLGCG